MTALKDGRASFASSFLFHLDNFALLNPSGIRILELGADPEVIAFVHMKRESRKIRLTQIKTVGCS